MKSIITILSALILTTTVSSFAYDSYEEYVRQQMKEYQTYLEEIDREFTSFLKQKWKSYEGEKKPKQLLDKPKPVDIPVAKPMPKPEPIKKITPKPEPKPEPVVEKPEPEPTAKPSPEPVTTPEPIVPAPIVKDPVIKEPVVTAPEPKPQYIPKEEAEGFGLSFYGNNLNIPIDKKNS